jgi:hypothetical protein
MNNALTSMPLDHLIIVVGLCVLIVGFNIWLAVQIVGKRPSEVDDE